jgi:hypothetical protein
VKCVNDTRCIEGSCGHLVIDCRLDIQVSLVRFQVTVDTYRNDTTDGLETQSNLISYNLF